MLKVLKKFNNKFIYLIILLITLVFAYSLFNSGNNNLKTYGLIVKGEGYVNDSKLELHNRVVLTKGDIFKTVGEKSMGIIEWGDGSITRLGGDSQVKIKNGDISSDKSIIKVGFELLNGKTWSNVISFIGNESYFVEYFSDTQAAVRGTVFDAYYNDKTNDGKVSVTKHMVDLTKGGLTKSVNENTSFSIGGFKELKDSLDLDLGNLDWEKINNKLDNELITKLKDNLSSIDDIKSNFESIVSKLGDDLSNLSDGNKQEIYNKLLVEYQKLNFISSDDIELFNQKLEYKKYMLVIGDIENKKDLFRSSIYDLKDSISTRSVEGVNKVISMIGNDYESFLDLGFSFEGISFEGFNKEDLDKIYNNIKNVNKKMLDVSKNAGNTLYNQINNIKDDFNNTNDKIINDIIPSQIENMGKNINNLINKNINN